MTPNNNYNGLRKYLDAVNNSESGYHKIKLSSIYKLHIFHYPIEKTMDRNQCIQLRQHLIELEEAPIRERSAKEAAQNSLAQLQNSYNQLNAEKSTIQTALSQSQSTNQNLQIQLAISQNKNSELERRIQELLAEKELLQQQKSEEQTEKTRLQQENTELRQSHLSQISELEKRLQQELTQQSTTLSAGHKIELDSKTTEFGTLRSTLADKDQEIAQLKKDILEKEMENQHLIQKVGDCERDLEDHLTATARECGNRQLGDDDTDNDFDNDSDFSDSDRELLSNK